MKHPSPHIGHRESPPELFRIDQGGSIGRGIVPAASEIVLDEFPVPSTRPDATSATVVTGTGPVLQHVQVFLVFWGSAWNASPDPSAESIANAAIRILFGPYMSGLAQYGGIGGGRLIGWKIIPNPDPPAPFSDAQVQTFLQNQLTANVLPQPSHENEILFAVIMPRLLLGSDPGVVGEHNFIFFNGLRVPYAWVMNDGLSYVTRVFSHELIEACSDPNLNRTIIQGGPGSPCASADGKNCEISDICGSTGLVVGVTVQSYWSAKDNACVVPRNILRAEVSGNPVLIKGRFLNPGNFELLAPLVSGGLAHFSRVNSVDFVPWFGPEIFGTNVGHFDAITMIQSNFTTGSGIGNLEVAALFQSTMLYYWREDVPPYTWHGPVPMNGFQQQLFTGNPVLIQGRFLHRGNFELVVPLDSGGMAHYSRVNDDPALPWFGPEVFGTNLGRVHAITMIQSKWTIGPKIGLLELVARVGGNLFFFFREDAPPYRWWGPLPPNNFNQPGGLLFAGNPVLVEGRFGSNADNFELIVPLESGGLAHYWRNNDSSARSWSGPNVFGQDIGRFDEISFIQSSFSAGAGIGNLELVARVGRSLFFYWRDDTSPFTWYGPRVVAW